MIILLDCERKFTHIQVPGHRSKMDIYKNTLKSWIYSYNPL